MAVYEEWYKITHKAPQFLPEAVYGLCEINREKIRGSRLVANPGCYTTCSILTCYPLVKEGLIDPDTPDYRRQVRNLRSRAGSQDGQPVLRGQ